MTKAVGEGIRVIAMLGMVILVPLTAMFGGSAVSRWTRWIYEEPWGVKSASAREATAPLQGGKSGDISSRPIQLIGQNGEDSSRNASSEEPRKPKGGITFVSTPPNRGTTLNETEKDVERFPFGEYGQSFSEQNGPSPQVTSWGEEEKEALGLSPRERGCSDLSYPWQKECQRLGRYLEELGAIDYRLEVWGEQATLYHFQCEVKVLPEGHLWTRHFEATASTPSGAMEKVLHDVRQWREGKEERSSPESFEKNGAIHP